MAAVLKTIQSGTITMADAAATDTVARGVDTGFDASVVLANTWVWFSVSSDGTGGTDLENCGVMCVLTDVDTITFTREASSGPLVIQWRLVEWTSGVIVQHLTTTLTGATGTQAIAGATTGGRFIVSLGAVCDNMNDWQRHNGMMTFDNDTQVGITRNTSNGTDITYSYMVIEYDGCTVQVANPTFTTTTNTTDTATITAVDTGKTLLFGTVNASLVNADDAQYMLAFANTTTINFTRNTGTSGTFEFTVYVVEFDDDSVVRRNPVVTASGTGTNNETITAVVLAQSAACMSGVGPFGGFTGITALTGTSAIDRHFVTNELTSTTNHRSIRGDSTTDSSYESQVVEFQLGGGAGVPVLGHVPRGRDRGIRRGSQ